MRLYNIMFIALIIFGTVGGFDISANAAVQGKVAGTLETIEGQRGILDGTPPMQEQKIVLYPFFRLQRNGSKIWVERIIVTFMMTMPKDSLKCDLNNPIFRKLLYELLLSGEPETTIQAQAEASLNQQLGMKVDATAQISHSVIIVR
jgi:hypothetical protein